MMLHAELTLVWKVIKCVLQFRLLHNYPARLESDNMSCCFSKFEYTYLCEHKIERGKRGEGRKSYKIMQLQTIFKN